MDCGKPICFVRDNEPIKSVCERNIFISVFICINKAFSAFSAPRICLLCFKKTAPIVSVSIAEEGTEEMSYVTGRNVCIYAMHFKNP